MDRRQNIAEKRISVAKLGIVLKRMDGFLDTNISRQPIKLINTQDPRSAERCYVTNLGTDLKPPARIPHDDPPTILSACAKIHPLTAFEFSSHPPPKKLCR